MVGVASPMLIRRPWQGIRFILAFGVGTLGAAAVVTAVLSFVSLGVASVGTPQQRILVAAALVALLGALDAFGRTPHMRRQTPKVLRDVLPPSLLGLVWGFDIGLFVTTIKKTSLLWGALILATAHSPAAVLTTVLLYSATWLLGQYLMTSSEVLGGSGSRAYFLLYRIGDSRIVFRGAGLGMVAVAAYLAVGW